MKHIVGGRATKKATVAAVRVILLEEVVRYRGMSALEQGGISTTDYRNYQAAIKQIKM